MEDVAELRALTYEEYYMFLKSQLPETEDERLANLSIVEICRCPYCDTDYKRTTPHAGRGEIKYERIE